MLTIKNLHKINDTKIPTTSLVVKAVLTLNMPINEEGNFRDMYVVEVSDTSLPSKESDIILINRTRTKNPNDTFYLVKMVDGSNMAWHESRFVTIDAFIEKLYKDFYSLYCH